MKRNLILILILLASAAAAYYFYTKRPDPTSNINRAESNFRIDNINDIGRILITQKDGTRADLRRSGDHWTVNENYRVRQTNIDFLLTGIQQLNLDHIPNRAASNNILESMAVTGIHVEFFDKAGDPMLSYYVGGVTQDERGTYFLKDGSSQPYCLVQSGFDGGLRVRYALSPTEWRDVHFWMEDETKWDTLSVDYPQQHQHAFVITRNGARYDVKPLYKTTPVLKGLNQNLVKSYLISLSGLACEEYINDAPEMDSIRQLEPFSTIRLVYPDHPESLNFYTIGNPTESPYSPAYEHFFIDYEKRDFMIAQYNVIKGAFRSYDYFFKE